MAEEPRVPFACSLSRVPFKGPLVAWFPQMEAMALCRFYWTQAGTAGTLRLSLKALRAAKCRSRFTIFCSLVSDLSLGSALANHALTSGKVGHWCFEIRRLQLPCS